MENDLVNKVDSEIKDIDKEISRLKKELESKKEYLEKLKDNNIINDILSNSTTDYVNVDIKILTNCKYDDDTKNPWSNVIILNGKHMEAKHTIKYPEAYKFNSDLKELLLKYINSGATTEDVSIVDENERLRNEVKNLKDENRKLKRREESYIEERKIFNSLSWWYKMKYNYKL